MRRKSAVRRRGAERQEVSGADVFAKTPSPDPSPKTPKWLAEPRMLLYGPDPRVRRFNSTASCRSIHIVGRRLLRPIISPDRLWVVIVGQAFQPACCRMQRMAGWNACPTKTVATGGALFPPPFLKGDIAGFFGDQQRNNTTGVWEHEIDIA